MFARVTQIEIDTVRASVEDALALFEREVLPQVRAQPGYRGVYVLSTAEGKALLMSLWETAEDARADTDAGFYGEALTEYVTLFRAPPGRERYEVRLVDAADGPQPI